MKPATYSFFVLTLFILGCEAVGILGSLFTATEITTWYATLTKPSFSPPNWLFGPVWTMLYALMGIAAWLVWKDTTVPKGERRVALNVFFFQLFLNGIWTPVFFGAHAIGAALAIIILLLASIAAAAYFFYRIRPLAAVLLVPYFAWVLFACVLNGALFALN